MTNDVEIKKKIRCGETSHVQFKLKFTTPKQMAEEMVAFANADGGDIIFGIEDKTGDIVGLEYSDIQEITRDLGNTANEHVRPTIYIRTDVVEVDGKRVLIASVMKGSNKPYKDLAGTIWVKQGADKRRVTENSEILSLFQESGEYHPDEASVMGTSVKDIDTLALDKFFERVYGKPMSNFGVPREQLLQNLHIIDEQGRLTTAGLMYFGERPQQFKPTFVIKAVWFYGNSIAGTEYRDSRDIEGTIPEMYEQGMMWLKSCLRRVQDNQSFNSVGKLEISETVLEELLQNALVHLDLMKPAAIRLLVFDNRVEIVNPGCIMGNHSIEEVKLGNSFVRNQLMANFCAKTMPYRGLGSGMPRVLASHNRVEFADSKEGNQFTASVSRVFSTENYPVNGEYVAENYPVNTETTPENYPANTKTTPENYPVNQIKGKTARLLVRLIMEEPTITRERMAEKLGITLDAVKKQIVNLREKGIVTREGSDKAGHWLIIGTINGEANNKK